MHESGPCDEGRKAFTLRQWRSAYDHFASADASSPIGARDLECFAAAAFLIGEGGLAFTLWSRLHSDCIASGADGAAAKWAFWIGLMHLLEGRAAQTSGWCGRARRLLEAGAVDEPAIGYGAAIDGLMGGADVQPTQLFDQAIAIAMRAGDPDLLVIGLLSKGQHFIGTGRIADGVSLLDEAMVTVTASDVAPVLTGIVYCAMVLTCQSVFDIERAMQWTHELDTWCASQPDLVPYRGQCLVHRSEMFQFQGDWSAAQKEAEKALAHLGDATGMVVGRAYYQRGELHRLRGEFVAAAAMYREADLRGCLPQPGAALLHLAEGRPGEARSAMQACLNTSVTTGPAKIARQRLSLLGPMVEILAVCGDLKAARAAAQELTSAATDLTAPLIDATALHATGRLLLGERKARAACAILSEAVIAWQSLENPYHAARARLDAGLAHLELGDTAAARNEFEAARSVFARLGAGPDLARAEALLAPGGHAGGLTAREIEVLVRVAGGETNRQIALALEISEHTVARHLSNIFDKTGAANRTEASVYAQRNGLTRNPNGQF